MRPGRPKLSIGLPVYNGGRYLKRAVDSVLGQSFREFELIVSDNGSTDDTEDICRAYQARDTRVRYIRHDKNRGAVFNWNFVVEQAHGEYFKWASANDYCAETFLAACIDVLDRHQDSVLCYCRTRLFSEESDIQSADPTDFALLDEDPTRRYLHMMVWPGRNNAMSGVIRRQALVETRLIRRYPHGDKVLMAELAAHGKFRLVDEPLFYRQFDATSSSVKSLTPAQLRLFLDPSRNNVGRFDLCQLQLDFLFGSLRRPIPLTSRPALTLAVARRIWWRRTDLWRALRGESTVSRV